MKKEKYTHKLTLYANDFKSETWKEICNGMGVTRNAKMLTIPLNIKDVEVVE